MAESDLSQSGTLERRRGTDYQQGLEHDKFQEWCSAELECSMRMPSGDMFVHITQFQHIYKFSLSKVKNMIDVCGCFA